MESILRHSLTVRRYDLLGYQEGEQLMLSLAAQRKADEIDDQLLLLEHSPVITLGRTADPKHLLVDSSELELQGIELVQCGRGGEITYHGPGQLVAYAIMKLAEGRRDLHRFLRDLEEVVIRSLAALDVESSRVPGKTGVWVSPSQKICSIGVRASSWVTSHGLALNLANTRSGFANIRPCGLDGVEMVNLIDLLPIKPDSIQKLRAGVEQQLITAVQEVFGCSVSHFTDLTALC